MGWDEIIKTKTKESIHYDYWLDKYLIGNVQEDTYIIELGCGWGDDTSFLQSLNCKLTSCDLSSEAIKCIHREFPFVETRQFDLQDKYPFQDNTADYIVADLCLHYFDNEEMEKIISEILRVMKPNGILYARVNSINDINYGVKEGQQIAEGLFLIKTKKKRFYTCESIQSVFQRFHIVHMEEVEINKYGRPKAAWELVLKKMDKEIT